MSEPSRDHFAASISVIAAEARLAECLVRAARGNNWVSDAGKWLDNVDRALACARLIHLRTGNTSEVNDE